VTLDVPNDLLRRQVTLIGSWRSWTTGQAKRARFIANRAIDLDHLFAHYRPLEAGRGGISLLRDADHR
jgi:threonine dehydrogenase-like Zn-dependent dehydrogenase